MDRDDPGRRADGGDHLLCRVVFGVVGNAVAGMASNPEMEVNEMDEEKFNNSMRKFLRTVGVTSQQEMEKAIRGAVESGKLKGTETLEAKMVLTVSGVDLTHEVKGDIELG
jgi:hypothetical protein